MTFEPLTPLSGRVKAARKLTRRSVRAEQRLFLAEGAKALTEAMHVPAGVVEVFATEAASEQYAAMRKAVDDGGVPWFPVTEDAIASLSGAVTPQGVVAVCRFLDVGLDNVLNPPVVEERGTGVSSPLLPTVVICADVRDPGNAGTVIRLADAAGAAGVILAGDSVDAFNPKTIRASAGSVFHLPVARAADTAALLDELTAAGMSVLATTGAAELDLDAAAADGILDLPTAWLFGSEAHGLPDELLARADEAVRVPIYGHAESLNLASAAAICLYASASAQRRAGGGAVVTD